MTKKSSHHPHAGSAPVWGTGPVYPGAGEPGHRPPGLFPYELETEPFALKERAEDGRLFGTVLALEPLQEQLLAPGDFQADLALGRYRPAAFEERYSPWAGSDL